MPMKSTRTQPPADPGDLIDFYLRWREFRDVAEGLAAKRALSAQERRVARWLIAMMDRISIRDLE